MGLYIKVVSVNFSHITRIRLRTRGFPAKIMAAVLATLLATLSFAEPLSATTGSAETPSETPPPAEDAEDCLSDEAGECLEPSTSDDGTEFVEQRPPAGMLKGLTPRFPDGIGGNAFERGLTRATGTDGHSCGSFYINRVSYTFNSYQGYTRIHVRPTWRYLVFLAGTPAFDKAAWNALANCIRTHGPQGIRVRSWAAIEDQFLCHGLGHPAGLTSWDLEGHRSPTSNPYRWVRYPCNW